MLGVIIALVGAAAAYSETRDLTLTAKDVRIHLSSKLTYDAWTFGGTVPGPTLKASVGDSVQITLVNESRLAHGIDIHAAQISPVHFASGGPATKTAYSFTPKVPGVFVYHCSADPMFMHIANGMYGMMIVAPRGGWPHQAAQEVSIAQGEFYGKPDENGFVAGNGQLMMEERPTYVVFDGSIDRYVEHPIQIKVGQLIRVYYINAGPNLVSTVHLVGAIFSTVYRSGNPENAIHGVQSFEVGPGDGAVFEFTVNEPGKYKFVDHAMARVYKGALAIFEATP